MARRLPPPASSWADAALHLARRVNRRARVAAVTGRAGGCVLVAAAAALGMRVLGWTLPGATGTATTASLLGLGLLVGILAGWIAVRRARTVDAGAAAWALDRLGGAGGRGLTAAVVDGPAASEAAWAVPPLDAPPRVRLLPPGGLVWGAGALLLGTLAFLAPEASGGGESSRPPAMPAGAPTAGGPAAGDEAGTARARAAEAGARVLDGRAASARRVRAALGLPPEGPLDPLRLESRLAEPKRREAAMQAALPGSPLAALLGGTEADGEALARLLDEARTQQAEAVQKRRDAVGARSAVDVPVVPAARRALVTRYLEGLE